jgi:hypothetical protein
MKMLANDSTSGSWVAHSDFAIIILTNPKYGFNLMLEEYCRTCNWQLGIMG